jgi:hypothetical protein
LPEIVSMNAPGRVCPVRYRYGAGAIAAAPELATDVLYVVGGLYGSLPALETIEAMVAAERSPATVCFNGDFNWFDVDDAGFREVNERVLRHDAILGNVEAEFGAPDDAAGCGCAYPENVDDGVVERSNAIHARLKAAAARHPDLLERILSLPMVARYRVGALRVGVVHGDADSLAGWRFDPAALDDPGDAGWRAAAFEAAQVDVFASTHTCAPAMRRQGAAGGQLVANNGAAGMPNATGERCGLITRISVRPSPHPARYGCKSDGVHVDALAVHYDDARWRGEFLANWPEGSPAWRSYYARIRGEMEFRLQESV